MGLVIAVIYRFDLIKVMKEMLKRVRFFRNFRKEREFVDVGRKVRASKSAAP